MRRIYATVASLAIALMPISARADVSTINATAALTAGSPTLTLPGLSGQSTCKVQVTGAWTGTLDFLISIMPPATGAVFGPSPTDSITTATGNGIYNVTCQQATQFQVTGVGLTGTANVFVSAGPGTTPAGNPGTTQNVNVQMYGGAAVGAATAAGTSATGNIVGFQGVTGGVPVATTVGSGTITANQGTPNAGGAQAWPVIANAGTGTFTVGGSTGTLAQTANGLKVDGSGVTQPVSIASTVGVTQSTSPWVTSVSNFPATQPVSGTVAATQSTSPWVDNLTQVNGTAIGSPTAAGTSASGNILAVQGVNGAVNVSVQQPNTISSTTLAMSGAVGTKQELTVPNSDGTLCWATTGGWTGTYELVSYVNGGVTVGASLPMYNPGPTNGVVNVFNVTANGGYCANVSGWSIVAFYVATTGTNTATFYYTFSAASGAITSQNPAPYNGAADAQTPQANAVVGLGGFDGTNVDRIRTSTVGTSISAGAVGVLGFQGVTGGVPAPVSGSGTFTVGGSVGALTQTANGLKVDGSGVTQPVSGTVAATQSTSPWVETGAGTAGTPATGVGTVQGISGGVPLPVAVFGNSLGVTKALACDNFAGVNVSAAGETQIIALAAGEIIHVCGYQLQASGASTGFQFAQGTGTNCGTGTTGLTGSYSAGTSGGPLTFTYGGGLGNVLFTSVGNALCINATGASVLVTGVVTYSIF
jgi:hypothetical protein